MVSAFLRNLLRNFAVVSLGACCLAAATMAQGQDQWRGQVTLYGWGAGIGGDLTPVAGGPTLAFDKSLGEVLKDLDVAVFVSGLATDGDWVVFGDLSHSVSSKAGLVPMGVVASGEFSQTSLTLAGGRRVLADSDTTLDLLVGARAWWVEGKASVPAVGVSLAPRKSFVDPIIAARVNYRLSDRWSALGYLDLGGFGVGSDLTYQAAVAVSYQMTDNLYLSGGYRHLYLDYSKNGSGFKGAMSGPLLGLTWTF